MAERLHAADFLRGLAALSIVFWHYQFYFRGRPADAALAPFYNNGQAAVDLFFVISGFILMHVYGSKVRDIRTFIAFVVRRIARLAPLQLVTLVATALIFIGFYNETGLYGIPGYSENNTYHFFLNVFLLQFVGLQSGWSFNGPSWTISSEFWVNIAFGLILLVGRRFLPILAIALVAASAICLVYVRGEWVTFYRFGGWLEALIVRTVAGFFAGVLVFYVWNRWPTKTNLPLYGGSVLLASLLLYSRTGPNILYADAAIALLASPILVYGVAVSPLAESIGRTRDGQWFGGISFSVYMWHFPIAAVLMLAGARGWQQHQVLMPLYVALVFTVATLSWRYIEIPARALIAGRLDPQGLANQSIDRSSNRLNLPS